MMDKTSLIVICVYTIFVVLGVITFFFYKFYRCKEELWVGQTEQDTQDTQDTQDVHDTQNIQNVQDVQDTQIELS